MPLIAHRAFIRLVPDTEQFRHMLCLPFGDAPVAVGDFA